MKGGRGVWRGNKALISLQQAALTRKSDFPGECLNNFANTCSFQKNVSRRAVGESRAEELFPQRSACFPLLFFLPFGELLHN